MLAAYVGVVALAQVQAEGRLESKFVRYTAAQSRAGVDEILEARDAAGEWRIIALSPNSLRVRELTTSGLPAGLSEGRLGLYHERPSLGFTSIEASPGTVVLRGSHGGHSLAKSVRLTPDGRRLKVEVVDDIRDPSPRLASLMSLYCFTPDGRGIASSGKPDSTYTPLLRPEANNVIGDHIFRSPFVTAQKGALALSIIPDLDVLESNRRMQTALELDCDNGIVDAPLLGYGVRSYEVVAHVRYSHTIQSQRVLSPVQFAYYIEPTAAAPLGGAYQSPVNFVWSVFGSKRAQRQDTQAMPWDEYARVCYAAVMEEAYGANKLGWFEHEIDGVMCGGIPAGWGYTDGTVSWQCWFNNLRSAWGLRYFGEKQGVADWIDKSKKMLNLALAAPRERGAFPTTYNGRRKEWTGCLIRPHSDCYYDLPSMAWKGIWMIEHLGFGHRPEDIRRVCGELARFFIDVQQEDGSYPSWMSREFVALDPLKHSAQSSLPAWFLMRWHRVSGDADSLASAKRAAEFLIREVIPQQRYYDFETFFSCSPKPFLTDHEAMMDRHTLSPPQNTLCMQWTAEAMRMLFLETKEDRYLRFGRMALDIMNTYQTAFAPTWITSANVFGGYGVQNSDGEHLDARQAQFGVTNFEWGTLLEDRELCERGVAAIRAAMILINHPLHEGNSLYRFPNYGLGLQPENVAHGGSDHQAGRTGFDWGEGSGLASAAWLLSKHGGAYVAKDGTWSVGIEPITLERGTPVTRLHLNAAPWIQPFEIEVLGRRSQVRFADALTVSQIALSGEEVHGTIRAWGSTPTSVTVHCGGATAGGRSEFRFDGTDAAFKTRLNSRTLRYGANALDFEVDPDWDFETVEAAWSYRGNLPGPYASVGRMPFGAHGNGFVGTCEDGFGGFDDSYTARFLSPRFFSRRSKLTLLVGGGSGPKTYVSLLDGLTGAVLERAHGTNSELMRTVTWDLTKYGGRLLQVEIVDMATGGWGHINVDWIRTTD